ncbi:hypothetical protein CTEN210_02432 [Chaetoceros tenuissimus]|uniref:ABC1 atypical kinase-like domain-containing protein n=1 Tax=Chaetoceros tenuissimus TaxID=426638 RepID=A0AAD3CHY7_9STRA|nr:hypothetical protein CTEN210_02432 [Chaetoceros tenuissimus]
MKKKRPMPVVGYNADEICKYYDMRPLVVGWRLNKLSLPLLGWYLGLLQDKLLNRDSPAVQRMRGAQLRRSLASSGSVALIKSGQALSLRPDLLKNTIWSQELGKLVDEVGSFNDCDAMKIIKRELSDLPVLRPTAKSNSGKKKSRLEKMSETDPILSLFEFQNSNLAVASASIGQVYKARIKRGAQLEAAIGKEEAKKWGGKLVAIKVQRPDVAAAASLDMYLLRRTATWLSTFRGGDLEGIADAFGIQLFGELDYVREANNCARFRELYNDWDRVTVPEACFPLTRKRVLVMEWIDGEKGPWDGALGIDMVSLGLKCSVDQLLNTGLFHADPHRGNLLRDKNGSLVFIDFGMMADVSEEERYGLVGLVIGLQTKDLPLITEKLLDLGFLEDTTQLDELVPRLRQAFINATGGTGKGSDLNFSKLQAELDAISSENILQFKTPPFFTVIIRSLTILEGFALSVDPKFKLVRGAYPYVLNQLLNPSSNERTPEALRKLLVRLLTVDGKEEEIEWERLREFLRLAQKAQKNYNPSEVEYDDGNQEVSRQTIDLFFNFLTSKTGLFLKKPLILELSQMIDGMASIGEANLLRASRGLIRPLPGGNGPVNTRRLDELNMFIETFQNAFIDTEKTNQARMETIMTLLREAAALLSDEKRRENAKPLLNEVTNVFQSVAVQVLEIRGSRAMRNMLNLTS